MDAYVSPQDVASDLATWLWKQEKDRTGGLPTSSQWPDLEAMAGDLTKQMHLSVLDLLRATILMQRFYATVTEIDAGADATLSQITQLYVQHTHVSEKLLHALFVSYAAEHRKDESLPKQWSKAILKHSGCDSLETFVLECEAFKLAIANDTRFAPIDYQRAYLALGLPEREKFEDRMARVSYNSAGSAAAGYIGKLRSVWKAKSRDLDAMASPRRRDAATSAGDQAAAAAAAAGAASPRPRSRRSSRSSRRAASVGKAQVTS